MAAAAAGGQEEAAAGGQEEEAAAVDGQDLVGEGRVFLAALEPAEEAAEAELGRVAEEAGLLTVPGTSGLALGLKENSAGLPRILSDRPQRLSQWPPRNVSRPAA